MEEETAFDGLANFETSCKKGAVITLFNQGSNDPFGSDKKDQN